MKPLLLTLSTMLFSVNAFAQEEQKTVFEISGQIMTDAGYNFNQVNPDYYDVMRPTQLPAYKNQYGTDGNVYFNARLTLIINGMKSSAA